jgi:hypothetical protein
MKPQLDREIIKIRQSQTGEKKKKKEQYGRLITAVDTAILLLASSINRAE